MVRKAAAELLHGGFELAEVDDSKSKSIYMGELVSQCYALVVSSDGLLSHLLKDLHLNVKHSFWADVSGMVN